MIDNQILNEKISIEPISSVKLPFEEWDYKQYNEKMSNLKSKWKNMDGEERKQNGEKIENYYRLNKLEDPTPQQKHYKLICEECQKRIELGSGKKVLKITDYLKERASNELLQTMENDDKIQKSYKFNKKNTGLDKNSGLRKQDAHELKSCLRQGRELFESGKNGNMMVKPLIFFYSLTAYAYALIVLNNPLKYNLGMLSSSHGIKYVSENYELQIGGDTPTGTFSDLLCSFPTINHIYDEIDIIQDVRDSINRFLEKKITVSIGALLSMIPELRDYYELVTNRKSKAFPLTISRGKDSRTITWDFVIGNGKRLPNSANMQEMFPHSTILNEHGKYFITVPADKTVGIKASIFQDIHGEFWYIDNPLYPVILPEICVHFLLLSAFSSIMRYRPHIWGSILLNETDSNVSLLISKYLSIFEHKFPLLLIQNLTEYQAFFSK